jgi:uncharacterized membrane protein
MDECGPLLVGAGVVGVAFLALFRSFARQTVWGIIYLKVLTLGATALYALSVDGGTTAGLVLSFFTALTAFVFWLWRREIELVAGAYTRSHFRST